jgi:hypothetical protein
MMPAQPDRDTARTARLKQFLIDYGEGNGRDEPLMTKGLLARAHPASRSAARRALEGAESFRFIACDGVRERGLERTGERVAELCYFKLAGPRGARFFTFWLAEGGLVADFDDYAE